MIEEVHGVWVITLLEIVDNSLSSHTNNHKNNFLVSGEKPAANIKCTKAKTLFCLSLHYNGDSGYLFVN